MFGRKKKKEQEEAFKLLFEGMTKLRESHYDDAAFVNDEEYGYTPKKPIMTFRVPGSNQYFENIVTENGETITWNRVGSTSDPDIDGMIDIYDIFCGTNKITTLYLNMYGVANSKHTPKGFIFKGADNTDTNTVTPSIKPPQEPVEEKPETANGPDSIIQPADNTDNIDDAIKVMKKAIFISKDPESLWISLAELYIEKGEMQNAKAALNKAQDFNSGHPTLEEAKQRIVDKLESAAITPFIESAAQSSPASHLSLDAAKIAILKAAVSAANVEITVLDTGEANQEQFAKDLIWYCAKRFRGFGQEKIQDESILTAFYAGICYTLSTEERSPAESSNIYSFLKNHMGIDQLERFANSLLNDTSDNENELWDRISPFITDSRVILAKVETFEEQQIVLEYAIENSFEIGKALATMKERN